MILHNVNIVCATKCKPMELFDFIFTALILRFALAYRASNKIANDEIRY